MKKYNPIYYLLFILLVMGAFASMAQNSYGLKIMGAVAFMFGLVFIIELITVLRKKESRDGFAVLELVCLLLLSVIFGFRVFYIHFPFIELVFGAAGIVLALLYGRKMLNRYRYLQPKNSYLARLSLLFHLSIILFLSSLALLPFSPGIARILGVIAILLLLVFLAAGALRRNLLVEGEKISAFSMVRRLRDHSIVIISLFLLFTLYIGLNRMSLLPGIYSDEFPKAYYELVDKATSKKEKPVDGKYNYEEFKEKYDEFLKHIKVNE